jgi:hypothetical protein
LTLPIRSSYIKTNAKLVRIEWNVGGCNDWVTDQ